MQKKKYIGQLISVKFSDRKKFIDGYVIDYNEKFTLLKYNPVDYIIDGYVIFLHKNIVGFQRDIEEKWKEKVMNLKGIQPTKKEIIPLTNLEIILKCLSHKFGVFQLSKKSEKICYIGKLKTIDDKELVIYNLNAKGQWKGQIKFKTNEIRLIEFDTDYINSLKLVSGTIKSKKK